MLYVERHTMLGTGYYQVGRVAGVALRWHWSVLAGAVMFGGLSFEPLLWLAFLFVLVVHELGHALLVRSFGFRTVGMEITGWGGHCRWRGAADGLAQACIAWGGIVAQLLLLVVTWGVRAALGAPHGAVAELVAEAFINVNLWIIGMNLLPFAPLDGARAWRLFPELRAAGWTPGRVLLHPLQRWVERRRRARGMEPTAPAAGRRQPQPSSPGGGREQAGVSAADAAEDDLLRPSPQAQRELAALLDRISDEAGRAKRRR
jgi:stage IV sporulation protein FB